MTFSSISFLIFFPIVTSLYFLLPHKWRWLFLLLASCFFYMSFVPAYILILFVTILIDYTAGILIEKANSQKKKKTYLLISIISTCSVLFVFKYFNFFSTNFTFISQFFHWNYSLHALKIILPIGLSFHTFQSLSYVIEVYRGNQKAERHFGIYSLYVMFYPQLVAGPIERPQNILHQFYEKHSFNPHYITEGLSLMLWGFFKKIVIADNAAGIVNIVYNNPHNFTGIHFILATILFAFQIFCDFSGYSDIAVGSAKVMGFHLMKNFNKPYSAKSITEFWQRWHISLTSWFKDYVYIPLGGNRGSTFFLFRNTMIVFLVSGLWHGAHWTYIVWGGLNGLYLVTAKITKKIRNYFVHICRIDRFPKVYGMFQTSIVFLLVCFSWIFFRSNSLSDAWYIITHLTTGLFEFIINITDIHFVKTVLRSFSLSPQEFIQIWIFIFFLLFIYKIRGEKSLIMFLDKSTKFVRWGFFYLLIILILFFGKFGEQPFIYFQF